MYLSPYSSAVARITWLAPQLQSWLRLDWAHGINSHFLWSRWWIKQQYNQDHPLPCILWISNDSTYLYHPLSHSYLQDAILVLICCLAGSGQFLGVPFQRIVLDLPHCDNSYPTGQQPMGRLVQLPRGSIPIIYSNTEEMAIRWVCRPRESTVSQTARTPFYFNCGETGMTMLQVSKCQHQLRTCIQ